MSKTYFTSDWHLGHKNILKYRDGFSSVEEHDKTLIENFNKVIRKRDVVFFLGDICFTDESIEQIKQLNFCRKILYLGNHDTKKTEKYLEAFDEVHAFRSYKNYWLSHCPIHPQELRNRKANIHGHLHSSILNDPDNLYFDVSPEKHNFELVDFEDIKKYFDKGKELDLCLLKLDNIIEQLTEKEEE